jgi:hypothetical protein
MDWRCGSSNRAPEALSSNPSSTKKKKKEAEKKAMSRSQKLPLIGIFIESPQSVSRKTETL